MPTLLVGISLPYTRGAGTITEKPAAITGVIGRTAPPLDILPSTLGPSGVWLRPVACRAGWWSG